MKSKKLKKILMVFGTRPEAIKMVSLYKHFQQDPYFEIELCITAQHREMLDQVLKTFDINPDYDLNLMKKNQNLYDLTADLVKNLKAPLEQSKPDLVFVHGDTTTTLTAALASFYADIPVCHIEAGLRTYDISKPFPEEMNRQVVSKLTKFHFCPTEESKRNLLSEGIDQQNIAVTGNTVIDTLHIAIEIIKSDKNLEIGFQKKFQKKIAKNFLDEKYVLITGHRRESFGAGFTSICEAISKLADKFKDTRFIYPVHLNPNVQKPVNEILGKSENIHLIEPLEYLDFVYLLENCYFVMTDSGGIQEEAPSLGKPVLVMRDKTERPEAIQAGTVKLVGSDFKKIYEGASELINDETLYKKMSRSINPYGDGHASERIREYIGKIK